MRVALYLEPPVRPRTIFYLDPREVHGANIGGSTLREDIVSLELAHIRVRRSTRGRRLPHEKEGSSRGTRMNQFTPSVHFRTDGAEWRCCLSSKWTHAVSVSPMDYQKRFQ
jgi:hypothetical protein